MQSGCDQRLPGYLQLIEAQREMQNLSELPCQRLLLLQMLSWAAARAREELQQALKRVFYKRHRRNTTVNPYAYRGIHTGLWSPYFEQKQTQK